MKITKKNIYDIQIWDGNYESDLIGYLQFVGQKVNIYWIMKKLMNIVI